MATYDKTKPAGADALQDSDADLRGNFDALQDALAREHTFPGTYGSTAGKHAAITATSLAASANITTSAGKVGIGTASPSTELHLEGTAPVITVDSTNAASGLRINVLSLDGDADTAFRIQDTGTDIFTLYRDGDVDVEGSNFRMAGSSATIYRDIATSLLTIAGGSSGANGANIALYGGSHATLANNAYYDADQHVFRSQDAGTEYGRFDENGALGIGIANPATTSILDLTSTTKGFLPPRMTTTQRNAISSPAEGLIVYDTTTLSVWYRNSTTWVEFATQ